MPLSWSVPELLKHKNEGFHFQEEVVFPLEMFHEEPEIRRVSPCGVQGVIEYSRRALTFHLHIDGTMVLPCAVTLVDVPYHFAIDTSEMFLLAGCDSDEETGEFVHRIENDHIDLTPYLVEAIRVEKPIRIVSEQAETNKQSGEGWTLIDERQAERRIDPRLAKLKQLLDDQ
ncbi:MAG: YceD family protein [Sporolactobacillus sp.]